MKPMIYCERRDREVLASGTYNGYEYEIVSLGSHPCAYVTMPETHPYYRERYDEPCFFPLNCNGGLTYGCGNGKIGWDYAHCGDYYYTSTYEADGKKWTTEEIFEEVKTVIGQLIDMEQMVREQEEIERKRPKPKSYGKVDIYRAVISINMESHPCYECGHMPTNDIVSDWYLKKEHAELYLGEMKRKYNYDDAWIEHSFLYNDVKLEEEL